MSIYETSITNPKKQLEFYKQLSEQLQQENKHLDGVNCKLRRKIGQLEDNWDKLKEWLENNWIESQDIWFVKIINKMQELEGNDKEWVNL